MDYSSEVRRRFVSPVRAGAVLPDAGDRIQGTGEDRSLTFWVRFQVRLSGRTIDRVGVTAFGCPHGIAAADLLAESLEGEPVEALGSIDLDDTARRIGLPREKFGKLLRIEDALRDCHRQAVERIRE